MESGFPGVGAQTLPADRKAGAPASNAVERADKTPKVVIDADAITFGHKKPIQIAEINSQPSPVVVITSREGGTTAEVVSKQDDVSQPDSQLSALDPGVSNASGLHSLPQAQGVPVNAAKKRKPRRRDDGYGR